MARITRILKWVGGIVAVLFALGFISWMLGSGTNTTSNNQQQVNSLTPATTTDGDAILKAWEAGIKNTPPPKGTKWRRIKPRATGELGCKPGDVRVNPTTGRLQGCR